LTSSKHIRFRKRKTKARPPHDGPARSLLKKRDECLET